MKHVFAFLLAILAFCLNAGAQLVVDSMGRVGIGTDMPDYPLCVRGTGTGQTVTELHQHGETRGLQITNLQKWDSNDVTKSLYARSFGAKDKKHVGIYSIARKFTKTFPSLTSIGVMGEACAAKNNIGVYGKVSNTDTTVFCAGVYGVASSTGLEQVPGTPYKPGIYAGYFQGTVKVMGKLYGTLYSPASTSASSMANASQPIVLSADERESVSDRLLSVQTLQFVREEETVGMSSSTSAQAMAAKTDATAGDLMESEYLADMDLDNEKVSGEEVQPETEMVRHYGVDAEQLKAVFPELVTEDQQGEYHVNYSEMVPLLLQSIRELSARVEELEGKKDVAVQKARAKATSVESDGEGTDIVRMSQNRPNPFSESSVITLNIPQNTKSAAIYIYDLSGKQLKGITVNERGETNVTVYATDLSAGMFVYSLVVDGNVAITRRMMVTEN